MSALAVMGLCLLSAFEITVSPDQPLPYSYLDDPLIVEVRSDTPCVADIELTATPDYDAQAPITLRLEEVNLGPKISRWCALKNLPTIRGPWSVSMNITVADVTETLTSTGFRIDRPMEDLPYTLSAYGDSLDRNALLALHGIAIDTVRIPVTHPDLSVLLDTLRTLNMHAIVVLTASPEHVRAASAISESYCDVLAGWALRPGKSAASTANILETFRGLACQKPFRLLFSEPVPVDAALERATLGHHLIVAESPEAFGTLHESLLEHGLDAARLEATIPAETIQSPDQFLPLIFEFMAQGAASLSFPVELVYAQDTLQPGLSQLNGLIHRISPGTYAGRIPQPGTTRTQIFAAGNHWRAVSWRTDDTSTIELPWSGAHPFSLMDAWGNSLESKSGEKVWTHPLSNNFLYITGLGGPVLKATLVSRAKREVKEVLDDASLNPAWSEALRKTLTTIAADPADVSSRVQFFALLRAFPEIEERWHAGQLTKPIATTALARLGKLARTLCQLEAALGASFLEPLQDTLARCEEFVSAYLTGATLTPQARERGDWLVAEVRRLMDESEALAHADWRIEADAVAALAEWRARALEFAAKAGPLSELTSLPEAEVVEEPPAEKAPEVTKKTKGKKK